MVKGEVYRVPGDSQGVKEEAYRASRGKLTESRGSRGRPTGSQGATGDVYWVDYWAQ